MKTYEKPFVLVNEELAEGVYAASGAVDCYSVSAVIHQTPQDGRGDYRIQLNADHSAEDGHESSMRRLQISFNMNVEYVGSNATSNSGTGTSVITLEFLGHNNAEDKNGLGDLIVNAAAGLAITGATCTYCDQNSGQH